MSIDAQIRCVVCELERRDRIYPRLVRQGKMHPVAMGHELGAMRAVLETLERVQSFHPELAEADLLRKAGQT
jgi:hypothetical protein